MKEFTAIIKDPIGLHARPATVAVKAACECGCDVKATYNGKTVDMKSIMGIMSLGVPTEAEITITCNGDDEDTALESILEKLRNEKVIQ